MSSMPPNQPPYGQPPEGPPPQGQPYGQPPQPYQQPYPPQQYQQNPYAQQPPQQGQFQQNPYAQTYMQTTPMCPRCGGYTKKVGYTWWGGVIGPRMMNLHKCGNCKLNFNAKTMQSADNAILIYSVVGIAVGLTVGILIVVLKK